MKYLSIQKVSMSRSALELFSREAKIVKLNKNEKILLDQ